MNEKNGGLAIQRIARTLGYVKSFTALDPTGVSSLLFDLTEHAFNHRQEILGRQMEEYYRELLNAEDDQFINLPDSSNLSELDFVALLGACSSELELEKAKLYARLTKSIAMGMVNKEYKRHFILTLRDSNFADLETLKLAYVCSIQNVMHRVKNLRFWTEDVLKVDFLGPIGSICLDTFAKAKLIEPNGLSSIGTSFVKAIYEKEQLTAESLGYEVWQDKYINLCYANNDGLALVSAFQTAFRKLRISSTNYSASELDADNFSSITTSGIVFIGDFQSVDYSTRQKIIKWCDEHTYQSVWIGFEGFGMPNKTKYGKSITITDINNLGPATIKAAKQLKYLVPDMISVSRE